MDNIQQIANEITKDSLNKLNEQVISEEQEKYKKLQLVTNQCLEYLEHLETLSRNELREMAKSEKLLAPKDADKAQLDTYKIRLQYKKIIQIFEPALDEYLESPERKLLYVFEDDNGNLSTYQIKYSDILYQVAYNEKSGRGSVSKLSKRFLDGIKEKILKDSNKEDPRVKKSTAAWAGTRARLNQYLRITGKESLGSKGGILLYKSRGVWQKFSILNYGDVKEAYVSSLFDENDKLPSTLGSPAFYSESLIKTFAETYIGQVSNKGALFEEDVVLQGEQYAVKSGGFSMFGVQQWINLMKKIKEKAYLDKQQLKNVKIEDMDNEETKGIRNKVEGQLRQYEGNSVRKAYDELKTILDK